METTQAGLDLLWWISVFELPALAALFALIWKNHQIQEKIIRRTREVLEENYQALSEALSAYKLEVAKTYASLNYLNAVEKRLTEHLLRIENKLDNKSVNNNRHK